VDVNETFSTNFSERLDEVHHHHHHAHMQAQATPEQPQQKQQNPKLNLITTKQYNFPGGRDSGSAEVQERLGVRGQVGGQAGALELVGRLADTAQARGGQAGGAVRRAHQG
jgi:hypothetical protein